MQITAAVTETPEAPFALQELELEPPRADEVLVRIVASGVCHTDVVCRDQWIPVPLPVVLGHEGSGVVEQVGDRVTTVGPGDRVVMSWGRGCGRCANCLHGQQAYCDEMGRISFGASRLDDGSTALRRDGQPVHSHFMGSSSFASHAVVPERHVVKVSDGLDLALLGPLACGIQTGAGAVFDALAIPAGSSIVVYGAGAVGLSAIMAAAVVGATRIVAVDLNPARLELACELGATNTIDAAAGETAERVAEVVGAGADFALETTADPGVLRTAFQSVHLRGVCALLGAAPAGTELTLDAFSVLLGRTLRGVIVGDGVPDLAIPRMIELAASGRFPFEKLIRFYDFADINQAVADSLSGETVKPVLRIA